MEKQRKKSIKVVKLNEPSSEMLSVKYFCKTEDDQRVDIVMKLKANFSSFPSNQIVQRYVLLMDVSGSMDERVGGDNQTLLDRIKVFAQIFVRKAKEYNWISIVSFSVNGRIVLPMTKMNQYGKLLAVNAIERMRTGGCTNISDGLFVSLDAIYNSTVRGQPNLDSIILFTDGQANEGIINPKLLVDEYRRRVNRMGRASEIPLSAITVGSNAPSFLNQVATALGSEALYCVDAADSLGNFVADMLIPMLLRKVQCIYDVNLELQCENNVTFYKESKTSPMLKKEKGDQSRTYFIYFIPKAMEKHICFSLKLPNMNQQDMNGKKILQVYKTFVDNNLKKHTSIEYLELDLTSMKQKLFDAHSIPTNDLNDKTYLDYMDIGPDASEYLNKTASYTKEKEKIGSSWRDAQKSMVKVLGQLCRQIATSTISDLAEQSDRVQERESKQRCQEAISHIEKIKEKTVNVLGRSNPYSQQMQEDVKQNFQDKLEFLSGDIKNCNPTRLTAMSSSLATEMPTTSGVFEPNKKQPFMPKHVSKEHSKIVEKITLEDEEGDRMSAILGLHDEEETGSTTSSSEMSSETSSVFSESSSEPEAPKGQDADYLFFSSMLQDFQKLDPNKKYKLKMELLKLVHSAQND